MGNRTKEILEAVSAGKMSVDEALLEIKQIPFVDLGYAKVDLQREIRQGESEVVYCESKTFEQIRGIVSAMLSAGVKRVLLTRLSANTAERLGKELAVDYYKEARIGIIGGNHLKSGLGKIVIASAGTSDMPVAEEAAITAEFYGNEVTRVYDVGVAGIHRLLARKDDIMSATVIIAVAGMEGALASVVGGMADCPVIAVPTSVGYGASFGGLSALLSMLNSCASGVSVVNIDNGFGAGYLASMINHMEAVK